MILGYDAICSVHGFWLPNDPRGSRSDFVGAWELLRFGPAMKVETRASLARRPHDQAARRTARGALKYPPVHFTGVQARAVGRGSARMQPRACVKAITYIHSIICERA